MVDQARLAPDLEGVADSEDLSTLSKKASFMFGTKQADHDGIENVNIEIQ